MNNTEIILAATAVIVQLGFLALAIFCIGFFVGFKREEKKFMEKDAFKPLKTEENTQEEKAKKEWKRFLSYDGSTDADKNGF